MKHVLSSGKCVTQKYEMVAESKVQLQGKERLNASEILFKSYI